MTLPIQIRFFRKLELYQELYHQDKKSKTDGEFSIIWDIERQILKWTTTNEYPGMPLTHSFIWISILDEKLILDKKRTPHSLPIESLQPAMDNLVQRNFAKKKDNGILIEEDGRLIGEIIRDIDGKNLFHKYKYFTSIGIIWIVFILGILLPFFVAISNKSI